MGKLMTSTSENNRGKSSVGVVQEQNLNMDLHFHLDMLKHSFHSPEL